VLKNCNILVDVGGGEYDHHQTGGNGARKDIGIKYASCGLIWRDFGIYLTRSICDSMNLSISNTTEEFIFKKVDEKLIIPIDLEDNGVSNETHLFSFVNTFLMSLSAEEKPLFDDVFKNTLLITIDVLHAGLKSIISQEFANLQFDIIANSKDGILFIPSQIFPWQEKVLSHNQANPEIAINFVVFPYHHNDYAAQCVPPSISDVMKQRIPFPKEWAGITTNLPSISGVSDATFCHNNLFFAKANTSSGIVKMCNIATKSYNKK